MNERIKEFINRATVVSYDELFNLETSRFDREKFAELIVWECAMVASTETSDDGVGEVIAQSIIEWFAIDWHQEIISKWEKAGVQLVEVARESTEPQTLTGLTLVVTGSLEDFTRDGVSEVIALHGGKTSTSVSKKTDYVLVGSDPGSKLAKAQELGVPVIDEARFKELLAGK